METQLDPQVTQCILTGAECCHKEGALFDKYRGVPIKTGEDSLVRTREEPSGTLCLERSPCATNSDEDSEVTQEKPVTTRVEQPHEKQLGAPKQQVE